MDLNIEGRWALVCAASKGLGKGCAQALVAEGVNVVITARGSDALDATARELRALNPAVTVVAVAGDITTSAGRTPSVSCPSPASRRSCHEARAVRRHARRLGRAYLIGEIVV